MGKILIKIVALFLLVLSSNLSFAGEKDLEIIDSKVYKKILNNLGITTGDVEIYKELFDIIKEGRTDKENKRINKLNSDVLLGHILSEKYLSTNYNSSFEELQDWLQKYSDYPQYNKIYKLAAKKGDAENLSFSLIYSNTILDNNTGYNWYLDDFPTLSNGSRKYVKDSIKKFRKYINSGKSRMARGILEDPKFRKLVPNRTWDAMAGTLITLYFTDNYDTLALEWAQKPSKRSDDVTSYWFGGLAAWRLGKYKQAANLFEKLSKLESSDDWVVSAGGYWAYRAYMKLNEPEKAQEALKEAAKYKRTFYGILANYKLDEDMLYNWGFYSFINDFSTDDYVNPILSSNALKRAVILASIGQLKLAEDEIKYAYSGFDDQQKELAMFIAQQYSMYSVAIQISNNLKDMSNDIYYDYVAYPLPNWDKNIWNADKALVLALIRQESEFVYEAVSYKGAKGLMQIMPNTAFHVTKDKSIKTDNETLFKPEYNLDIGQKYVNYLLDKSYIDGNLFFLTTAYNAGPGNLIKWKRKVRYKGDPLMFIEAIPSRQTRLYIKRVMANYWIYSSRLGKEAPSLEQLINNQWPTL